MSPTLGDLQYMLQLVPDNVDLVLVRLFDAVFAQWPVCLMSAFYSPND